MSALPLVNPRMGRTAYLRAASAAQDPPVNDINDISDYVSLFKSKRNKQLCLNKYDKAEETRLMMEKFSRRAQTSLYEKRRNLEMEDFKERLTETNTTKEEFDDVAKARISEFEETADAKIQALKERHLKELEEHEKKKPTELPAKYRKRSSDLINLYRTERRLSVEHNIAEMKLVRAEIEAKEAVESKNVMERAINDWKIAGQHLKEKQRKELEAMLQRINSQRLVETEEIGMMRESINKREKILSNEITGVQKVMSKTTPHAMRRHLIFTTPSTKSRALVPDLSKDLHSLVSTLPKRSREILSSL